MTPVPRPQPKASASLFLLTLAAFLHECLTGVAVIAIVCLFLVNWLYGHPLLHPYVTFAVVATLVVGCGFGRACLRRINHISGNDDVSALLESAYYPRLPTARPQPLSSMLHGVIPVQIIATAVIALALIVIIQQPALSPTPEQVSAGSSQGLAHPSTQGQPSPASAARGTTPTAKPLGEADSEWIMWPAVAAIALSELMFIGWMFEGKAVADELAMISRRWRHALHKQTPAADPFAAAMPTASVTRHNMLATAALAAATLAAATKDARTKDVERSDTQTPEPSPTDTPPPKAAVIETAAAALATALATVLAEPAEGSRADTPPPGPAEIEGAVAPVRRALYLCTVLRQYGVNLTREDPPWAGDLT